MHEPVILFDGLCNLCNGWVDFVMRRDRKRRFLFSALQSESAAKVLAPYGISASGLAGIYLVKEGRVYSRSGAVLRILKGLGGLWPTASVFLIVPPFIRDAVYRFISARRYKWFGKRPACRIAAPHEKERFLP